MRKLPQIIGLGIGIWLVVPAILIALASAGAGHGDYFWDIVLLPYATLALLPRDDSMPVIIFLACVQFPIYGWIAGGAFQPQASKLRLWLLLASHGIAVLLAYLLFHGML